MHIVWQNDYNLGIEVIDGQHLRIVDYINALHDAILMPEPRKHIHLMQVLKDVVDYTESHFSFEETMLEDVGYPFLNAHKKVHELFIRRLNDYIRRYTSEGHDVAIELRDTLSRWLINHIKNEDADYCKYIRKMQSQPVNRPITVVQPKPRDVQTASLWRRLFWG